MDVYICNWLQLPYLICFFRQSVFLGALVTICATIYCLPAETQKQILTAYTFLCIYCLYKVRYNNWMNAFPYSNPINENVKVVCRDQGLFYYLWRLMQVLSIWYFLILSQWYEPLRQVFGIGFCQELFLFPRLFWSWYNRSLLLKRNSYFARQIYTTK